MVMKAETFKFDRGGEIIVEESFFDDNIELTVQPTTDTDGNDVEGLDSVVISMDNHQAYLVAFAILKRIRVDDNRGSC